MTELCENFVDGLLRLGHRLFFSPCQGFQLTGIEEAGQPGSGRYLHTNSTIATEAQSHIRDSGTYQS
jgi:hypothetical protein